MYYNIVNALLVQFSNTNVPYTVKKMIFMTYHNFVFLMIELVYFFILTKISTSRLLTLLSETNKKCNSVYSKHTLMDYYG